MDASQGILIRLEDHRDGIQWTVDRGSARILSGIARSEHDALRSAGYELERGGFISRLNAAHPDPKLGTANETTQQDLDNQQRSAADLAARDDDRDRRIADRLNRGELGGGRSARAEDEQRRLDATTDGVADENLPGAAVLESHHPEFDGPFPGEDDQLDGDETDGMADDERDDGGAAADPRNKPTNTDNDGSAVDAALQQPTPKPGESAKPVPAKPTLPKGPAKHTMIKT